MAADAIPDVHSVVDDVDHGMRGAVRFLRRQAWSPWILNHPMGEAVKPQDLYAMPTIAHDSWTWSPATSVMFGDDVVRPSEGDGGIPLTIAEKCDGHDENQGSGLARWMVLSWEGVPFGAVAVSEHDASRVVTDPDLYRKAWAGLMYLRMPDIAADTTHVGKDTDALDHAGGQSIVVERGIVRVVPRRLMAGGTMAVDPDALADALVDAYGPGGERTASVVTAIDRDVLLRAVLASTSTSLRRTASFDAETAVGEMTYLTRGWPALLVADADRTYVVATDGYDMRKPLLQALRVVAVGPASDFDRLGPEGVLEVGEVFEADAPRP